MYNRCQSPILNHTKPEKVLPYKRRLENQQKINSHHSSILNSAKKQPINHSPGSDLKAKIIKAILTNSQTIQKQIDYKNSIATFITPLKSKNSIVHLNLRLKNSKKTASHPKQEPNLMSTRYNSSLQVSHIGQPMSFEIKRLNFEGEIFSRCHSQRTSRSSRSNSTYSARKQKNSHKIYINSPFLMRQRENIQIRPWAVERSNDKQFQYF